MDVQGVLKRQYHGGLAMLRQAVERCPDEIWVSGTHPRNFWRIAYHGLFYVHLYLQPNPEAFVRWEKDREDAGSLWGPMEVLEPYTQAEILDYSHLIGSKVDGWVDALDLESPETGFYWYKNMGKLDHQVMNIRHLQGHVGQLSELLMVHGIDTDWIAQRSS